VRIVVCIKQVPDTTEIKIDPETNTLIRSGVPSIVNPFDEYALETAARIKDENSDTEIIAISMGPEQAKTALKQCLSVGADKAYLISDRAFGGSDTLATSYILSMAIKKIEELDGKVDIIFCGKQAIDGDTAQVGPEIAEKLDYPQATYVIEASIQNGCVRVKRETDEFYEIIEMDTPCVVTVTKPYFEPRYPTVKSKMQSARAEIPTLSSADLDVDLAQCGLKGSPTKVKKSFTPSAKNTGITIQEETTEQTAQLLFNMLSEANII